MNEAKKTYYISVGTGEIMRTPKASPWQFKIKATDDEITEMREVFQTMQDNSIGDFFRAHVPFVEYSHDPTNDVHDENLHKIYSMIYELGDQEAKQHIQNLGILDGFKSD
ncbi:hydrolase [Siminovitchia sp. 179-K 8D1 HS]|uniref:hydrolase n=1 Tax=Siminovitchia sp. 179-K 8D1 HS TaxID=3142385 RepID=UPI0039A0C8C7